MEATFKLSEIAKQWGKEEIDILHLAEVGEIVLSVAFYGYTTKKPLSLFEVAMLNSLQKPQNMVLDLMPDNIVFFLSLKENVQIERLVDSNNNPLYVYSHHSSTSLKLNSNDLLIKESRRLQFEETKTGKFFITRRFEKDTDITNIAKILDKSHPWHSEPLATAVNAWVTLYSERHGNKHDNQYKPKDGGNTKLIDEWLSTFVDKNMGNATKGHYRFIINPDKKTGPTKLPE